MPHFYLFLVKMQALFFAFLIVQKILCGNKNRACVFRCVQPCACTHFLFCEKEICNDKAYYISCAGDFVFALRGLFYMVFCIGRVCRGTLPESLRRKRGRYIYLFRATIRKRLWMRRGRLFLLQRWKRKNECAGLCLLSRIFFWQDRLWHRRWLVRHFYCNRSSIPIFKKEIGLIFRSLTDQPSAHARSD